MPRTTRHQTPAQAKRFKTLYTLYSQAMDTGDVHDFINSVSTVLAASLTQASPDEIPTNYGIFLLAFNEKINSFAASREKKVRQAFKTSMSQKRKTRSAK